MATKWKTLPKRYTPTVLLAITDLASTGASKASIARELDLHHNCWHLYLKVSQAYTKGLDLLAEKVRSKVIKSMSESFSDRKLLVERLGLFQSQLELDFEIKDLASCNKSLGLAMKAFLEGRITEQVLEAFRKSVSTLSQSYVDVDTAERLTAIEEVAIQTGGITCLSVTTISGPRYSE